MDKKHLSADEFRFLRFRKGDERAFEFYFKEYYNRIVGFCMQYVADEDKARSIAQEAFIKLWMNRKKVQKINGIRAFLYTSSKTECLNLIRHKKVAQKYRSDRLQEKEDLLHAEILGSLNFDPFAFSELEGLIKEAIEDLPERSRLVFIKKRVESKKNKEIAEELGITLKAVEANMTRAMKFLKSRLSDYLSAILAWCILHF